MRQAIPWMRAGQASIVCRSRGKPPAFHLATPDGCMLFDSTWLFGNRCVVLDKEWRASGLTGLTMNSVQQPPPMKRLNVATSILLASVMTLVVGCRTTTPVKRQTHSTLDLDAKAALAVLVKDVPSLRGSTATYNFNETGFSWTEYIPPPPPVVIMPTTTTLYSPSGGGIVSQTYTTPGMVIPSSGRGTTLHGNVAFADIASITQVESRSSHWINMKVTKPKRVFSVPLGKCSPEQAQRVAEAILVLSPNVK
jgi:hypothetical protein